MKIINIFTICLAVIFESFFGVFASNNIGLQDRQHDKGVTIRDQLRGLRKLVIQKPMSAQEKEETHKQIRDLAKQFNANPARISSHEHSQQDPQTLLEQFDNECHGLKNAIELEEKSLAEIKVELDLITALRIIISISAVPVIRILEGEPSSNLRHLNQYIFGNNAGNSLFDFSCTVARNAINLRKNYFSPNDASIKKEISGISKLLSDTQKYIDDITKEIDDIKTKMDKITITKDEMNISAEILSDRYIIMNDIDSLCMQQIWSLYNSVSRNLQYMIAILSANLKDGREITDIGRDFTKKQLGIVNDKIETFKNRTANNSTNTLAK